MKSSDLVKLLNLPDSTLRKYAQDYAEYLSSTGGAGRHRDYSDHDARVLRLIVDMKSYRVKPQDIDATLRSLQAGEWAQLPELNQADQSIIPTQENQVAGLIEMSALQREVDVWRGLYEASTSDRDELLRRLHRAETLLELYQSGELTPKRPE